MADKTVRYVQGQFIDPNIDSNKQTANNDVTVQSKSAVNGLVVSQLVNQAKNVGLQVATRKIVRSGNISQADKLQKTLGLSGDLLTIGSGFLYGGPIGGIGAGIAVGVSKGLEIEQLNFDRALEDFEAQELARRQGSQVPKRSEYR